jgi:hypothetical protein
MPFTHLHVHSTYSDGLANPFDLMRQAQALGCSSLALTDHNSRDGHGAFLAAAQCYPVHPLLGAELRVHATLGHGHMVVLSTNSDEYSRLRFLIRRKKQIRLGDLRACGIVTSGCLGGVTARLLRRVFSLFSCFRLQRPPLAGWSAVCTRVALTYAAAVVIGLAAQQAGRPDLIRSPKRVLAHTWEGLLDEGVSVNGACCPDHVTGRSLSTVVATCE